MKHKIEHIQWLEVMVQRPYQLEIVWETLTHLSALSPRGAVVWEARGRSGHVTHLLGADKLYINKIKEVFRAHGDVQFRSIATEDRQPISMARTLKISHPQLSLNTNIAESAIRAGLAALAEDKSGREVVLQVVLGRGFAPSPVSPDLQDPTANWLEIITGCVSKATAEARKSVREKAEQHGFEAAIRIGVSGENGVSRLRIVVSALKVLESTGVRIRDEAKHPEKLNTAHVPWHFPLRLSVKELSAFLLLPTEEEELPGIPGPNPKIALLPPWYRQPISPVYDRSFAISMDITPKNSAFRRVIYWSTPTSSAPQGAANPPPCSI